MWVGIIGFVVLVIVLYALAGDPSDWWTENVEPYETWRKKRRRLKERSGKK